MTGPALALQWGLLVAYLTLVAAALIVGYRRPVLRPWAFAVGFLSATHVAYYWLFLVQPDVLDSEATMMFSIALRYQVLFTAMLTLGLAVMRDEWRR